MKLTEYVDKHRCYCGRPFTSPRQDAILDILRRDGPTTTFAISEEIGEPLNLIQGSINRLKRRGKVQKQLALHVRRKPVASGWLWSLVQ